MRERRATGGWGAGHQESEPRGRWALLHSGDVGSRPREVAHRWGCQPGWGEGRPSSGQCLGWAMQPSAQDTGAGLPLQNPTSRPRGASPGADGCKAGVRKAEPQGRAVECCPHSAPSSSPRPLRVRRATPGALSSSAHAWTLLSTERPQVLRGGHGGLPDSRLTGEVSRPARRPSPDRG